MAHPALSRILVTLGTLIAIVAILAVWVSRQVLETDQWTTTSSELLEDPAVQTAVSGYLVDTLYANVNVSGELRSALPPRLQPLAAPAAGALRQGAEQVADRALDRPRVQEAWEQANREAHAMFVRVIEGGSGAVSTEGGVVTLNLKTLLDEIATRTGVGGRAAERLPASVATIQIVRSDQLGTVQSIARALKPLAVISVLLMLVCFGGAIWLAAGRRREILRACGLGLVFAGATALVIRSLLGNVVVEDLSKTASVEPAIEAVWTIGTSFLVGVATATIAYGVLTVGGAWLAGPTRMATGMREWLAPYLRDARLTYGVVAAIVLLVLLWGPTEATRRPVPALILIVLLVAGVEVLRRQVAAEHPHAERGTGVPATERMRAMVSRAREAVRPPSADGDLVAAAPGPAPAAPSPVADLERLDELHRTGVLDDDEFTAAKHRVLDRA